MKKRKLNSKNPKYLSSDQQEGKKVKTRKLMCNAKIRTGSGQDTGRTAAVYAVWHEN
tara:strand:- start:135 stop:305 length:171 start_codon:yes stop_codon:yes gene_type:complete